MRKILYIGLLLLTYLQLQSQELFELDTMYFSCVESGKSYNINKLSVYDGIFMTPNTVYFVADGDTLNYQYEKFVMNIDNITELDLIVECSDRVLRFYNIQDMICSNSKVFISILFDLKNRDDSNIVYKHNSSSCGDMYISKEPLDIESSYHIISITSYKY